MSVSESIRVLYLDDSPEFGEVVETLLSEQREAFVVRSTTEPREVLSSLDTRETDCLVTDYKMQEMDGLELLERVRPEHPELPIILFTGKGTESVASRAISAGVTDYVRKSDDREVFALLANRIEQAVERHERTRELERVYEAMEASMDGMAVLDESERYTYVNQAHAAVYGYDDPDVFLGETWRMCYDDERADRLEGEILPAMYEDGEWRGELLGQRADGTKFHQELSLSRLDGGGLVCVVRDVTDRTEAEQKLRRRNERLDEFASFVSHDLRNPLNVATLRLDLAREEVDSEHLDHIEGALERMERLLENLLTLAREGDIVGETEPVELATVIAEAWESVETGETTLQTDTDVTVRADSNRLTEVFENLFDNAVEHGGQRVTVGDLHDGFYVADDGPGIPDSKREQVFDSGYSTGEAGVGVGLAVVEQVVDAHDWDVRVAESASGGARFEITGVERIGPS